MHDSLGSANVQLGAIRRGLKRSGEQAAGICDYAAHDAAQVSARRRLHAIQARGRDESENALSAKKKVESCIRSCSGETQAGHICAG